MHKKIDRFYDSYKDYGAEVYEEIRKDTYGVDIGQNSWTTVAEYMYFFSRLGLSQSVKLLEVASGSGGPAIFTVKETGCEYVGIDINQNGVANAKKLAKANQLDEKISFGIADASGKLSFPDYCFDALICIDSINHLRDRASVLKEFYRVLKNSGHLVFTDPVVVTGILSSDEIAIRSSLGYFVFVPSGENERLLREAGFSNVTVVDVTDNIIMISERWYSARAKRRPALVAFEGEEKFDSVQSFLQTTHTLSAERRLSRILYSAVK